MPIDIDEFEAADPERLYSRDRSPASDVLEFLAFTPKQAYTRQEILGAMDVTIFELASILSELEAEGLVRSKANYWMITDRGKGVSRE